MNSNAVRPALTARLGQAEQRRDARDVGQRRQRDRRLGRAREKLQRRRGDDAERAFRADEEIAQVVAGVVLLQGAQAVPHLPVGRHHLEPQASARARCRRPARRRRRRWSPARRRSGSCLPTAGSAETAGRLPRRRPAPRPRSRPPRRSSCRPPRRPRGLRFSRDSESTTCVRRARGSARRRARCCRPAGRCRCRPRARSARICATSRVEPGRNTSGGGARVQAAQLAQVGQLPIGVRDGVRRTDDIGHAGEAPRRRRGRRQRSSAAICAACRAPAHGPLSSLIEKTVARKHALPANRPAAASRIRRTDLYVHRIGHTRCSSCGVCMRKAIAVACGLALFCAAGVLRHRVALAGWPVRRAHVATAR